MKVDKWSTRMPMDSDPSHYIIQVASTHDSLTREFSQLSSSSLEDYHVQATAAVPFDWESQPGTPKRKSYHRHKTPPPLPPLTPPPSYKYYSASASAPAPAAYNHKRSTAAATPSTLRKPNFQILQSIIFTSSSSCRIRNSSQPSSPTLSSSSSNISLSVSGMTRKSSSTTSVPSSPTRSFQNIIRPSRRSSAGSQKQQSQPPSFDGSMKVPAGLQAAEDEEDGYHCNNSSSASRRLPALLCLRFGAVGGATRSNCSRSRARCYSTAIKVLEADPDLHET